MSRLFVFADEAGDFDFARNGRASDHFILCTVSMHSCEVGNELAALRRQMAWDGLPLGEYFHASTDQQIVRDAVFSLICRHDFRVQATVMEKCKAQPQVRTSRARFYQYGWYYHFKHGMPSVVRPTTEVLVTAASLGNRKEQVAFKGAVDDVMRQTLSQKKWVSAFCPAAAEPCIQVADYCAWAIQRKWERLKDERSYRLIKDRITYEFDLWKRGAIRHY